MYKCKIQWIDSNGNSTADDNDAADYAYDTQYESPTDMNYEQGDSNG